jgi:hypothetical protein
MCNLVIDTNASEERAASLQARRVSFDLKIGTGCFFNPGDRGSTFLQNVLYYEDECSSEMLSTYKITWWHILEDSNFHSHCCENIRSHL